MRSFWLCNRPLLFSAAIFFVFTAVMTGCNSQAANKPAVADHPADVKHGSTDQHQATKLGPPTSIASEHREIHEQLEAVLAFGGKTGAAAKVVEERLSEHFNKEEEYALPQLALLPDLAAGHVPPDQDKAIELSDKLKSDMPTMLSEHKGIVEALNKLEDAAREENKEQARLFAEKLKHHAETEEQVMYPTAILIGEYLKLKRTR